MTLSAECVLQYKSFSNAAELWTLLAATHPALADAQNAEMSPENEKSFGIQLESGEIHFSPVANHRLDRLDIEGMPNSVADAEDWLSPLLGDPRFIQARIYDEDYDHVANWVHRICGIGDVAGRRSVGLDGSNRSGLVAHSLASARQT